MEKNKILISKAIIKNILHMNVKYVHPKIVRKSCLINVTEMDFLRRTAGKSKMGMTPNVRIRKIINTL